MNSNEARRSFTADYLASRKPLAAKPKAPKRYWSIPAPKRVARIGVRRTAMQKTGQRNVCCARAAIVRISRGDDAVSMNANLPTLSPPELMGGPYKTPACREGGWVMDEVHGLVQVNGFSEGRLSWPTRKRPLGGPRALALTEELVRAIRLESAVAVSYWWGISTNTVRKFRRLLHVPRNTPGTIARHGVVAEPPPPEAGAKGRKKVATELAIRQRIADTQRGKHVSAEVRQKLSAAHKGVPKPEGWGQEANRWMMEGKAKRKRESPHEKKAA